MSGGGAVAPLVSVCIPTYKGAATLGAAIESVLGQTLVDLELVVVDDGSPDDTAGVVASFDDPRLRYVRNPTNLGPEGNWNRCLELARGTYFKLLPHDDTLRADCLARQVAVFRADADEQLALVFSARSVLAPDGRILMQRGMTGTREGRLPAQQVMRACVHQGTNIVGEPGAVLMRRNLCERVGCFDATHPYVIDLDYWFRMLAHGDAFYLEAPLAGFRVSATQWSVVIGRRQDRDFVGLVQRAAPMFKPPLTALDRTRARVRAWTNVWLRQLFYWAMLR